jgi:hypothetical protein
MCCIRTLSVEQGHQRILRTALSKQLMLKEIVTLSLVAPV